VVDYDISPLQILILLLLPVDYDISPLQILKLEQYHKLLEAEGESVSPMTKPSKIFKNYYYPSLMTVERKLV
jgi:hypothetical protein